jgi:hypothetical protein
LKGEPNHKLSLLAKITGAATTPLAKNVGIRGWRDYCIDVTVAGTVLHSAHSWDGYQTVDISLDRFELTAAPGNYVADLTRYIRLELRSSVRRGMAKVPQPMDHLEATGHLVWDGDGFLEVHPLHGGAVHVQ